MLMNVFLFVPIGLTVPFVLLDKVHNKIMLSTLLGLGLGIGIEVMQFTFGLGRAEVDDVICNTLGVLIGSLSFLLFSRLERSKSR
jgi:glycopeptide antibiotics resistance protein